MIGIFNGFIRRDRVEHIIDWIEWILIVDVVFVDNWRRGLSHKDSRLVVHNHLRSCFLQVWFVRHIDFGFGYHYFGRWRSFHKDFGWIGGSNIVFHDDGLCPAAFLPFWLDSPVTLSVGVSCLHLCLTPSSTHCWESSRFCRHCKFNGRWVTPANAAFDLQLPPHVRLHGLTNYFEQLSQWLHIYIDDYYRRALLRNFDVVG